MSNHPTFDLRATQTASLRSDEPVDAAGPAGAIDGANERAANSPLDVGQRTPPSTVPWKPGKRTPAFHSPHRLRSRRVSFYVLRPGHLPH
jgi:hypothetical protein